MIPSVNLYAHKPKHHEYLSERRHQPCFSLGNAWWPYPRKWRIVVAFTFPTQRKQWVQRTGFTWPLPFLERPWFLKTVNHHSSAFKVVQLLVPTFSWKAFWFSTEIRWYYAFHSTGSFSHTINRGRIDKKAGIRMYPYNRILIRILFFSYLYNNPWKQSNSSIIT